MKYRKRSRNGGHTPFIDPAFADALAGKSESNYRKKKDYKALQLCRQVQRILTLFLGTGSGDEILGQVYVADVTPGPDATHLLVHVTVPAQFQLVEILERLAQITPRLRAEVARGITRKRAPELSFIPLAAGEVSS